MDFDAKALAKKVQADAKELIDRVWEETTKIVEKFQEEAKGFISNFKHYNKVEIGLYAALALSLTVALKSKSCSNWNVIEIAMCQSLTSSNGIFFGSVRLHQGRYQDIGFGHDFLYSQLACCQDYLCLVSTCQGAESSKVAIVFID
jgi:hypothetical protein